MYREACWTLLEGLGWFTSWAWLTWITGVGSPPGPGWPACDQPEGAGWEAGALWLGTCRSTWSGRLNHPLVYLCSLMESCTLYSSASSVLPSVCCATPVSAWYTVAALSVSPSSSASISSLRWEALYISWDGVGAIWRAMSKAWAGCPVSSLTTGVEWLGWPSGEAGSRS